jgi:cellobiose phosphorylase
MCRFLFDPAMGGLFYPIGILLLLSALQVAITLVNWLSVLFCRPVLLPGMDYTKDIPKTSKTMLVVPAVPVNEVHCRKLLRDLEIRFCGNRDKNLHFGLLTDFADADQQCIPGDEDLLNLLQAGVNLLNSKYSDEAEHIFYLFHRPRKYNPQQNKWMGEERKRGKLRDLCRLLRQLPDNNFGVVMGNQSVFPEIKYVITLDQDTMLPPGAAAKMISVMAHPLNMPVSCKRRKIITRGNGILQPGVAIGIESCNRSRYAGINSNAPGIDGYTRVYADLYQDLFGEGTFVGKGIFDVNCFLDILDERFPDNRILSHDLLEGCYLRSGSLTTVQLFEEHPVSYLEDVKRRHRWIRGDWQIAAWILPFVPGYAGTRHKNPLSLLSRWKIFDNLRRSIMPAVYLLLLVCCWMFASIAFPGTMIVVVSLLLPAVLSFLYQCFHRPLSLLSRRRWKRILLDVRDVFLQYLHMAVLLPYEALYASDAIVRTNIRLYITHRHTLEWHQSGRSAIGTIPGIWQTYRYLWITPCCGLIGLIYVAGHLSVVQGVTGIISLGWLLAPLATWYISRADAESTHPLNKGDIAYLRELARGHWHYFDTFMGPDDNWLPPDHYQEYPVKRIAHRTSPTNIGVALLAGLAANDFGYITQEQLLTRLKATFDTMNRLERFNNHFYNWYDTRTLKTVTYQYVSTVDSGNLAASLLTLWQGIHSLPDKKIVDTNAFEGLYDVVRILIKQAGEQPLLSQMSHLLRNLSGTKDPGFLKIQTALHELDNMLRELPPALKEYPDNDVQPWALLLSDQLAHLIAELKWCGLYKNYEEDDPVPTLRDLKNSTVQNPVWRNEVERRWKMIEDICRDCKTFSSLDYSFLYNERHKLLHTGFNAATGQRDKGFYDNLFSEARLATFIGIADNKLPQESWFALGRSVCYTDGELTALSWSGSMFEYLMPLLVMPGYKNTLLDLTCRSAVQQHINYGKKYGLPWGISECAHNDLNAELHYHYWPRGVPALGLCRVKDKDMTIAPYATALALMIHPSEACANLRSLTAKGVEGHYGFYEAIDFTPARLKQGAQSGMVYSYMAHHQGMSFLSFAHAVLNKPMQERFLSHPQHQSAAILLQERMGGDMAFTRSGEDPLILFKETAVSQIAEDSPVQADVNTAGTTRIPDTMFLSNGNYHVMVNNSGSGYSRWNDTSITRWREDIACDNYGITCYIRDLETDTFYSAGYMPTGDRPEIYEVQYVPGKVSLQRSDHNLDITTHITVSQEHDMELRRMVLHNRSAIAKCLEITSYAEIALSVMDADVIHPALGKLALETEILHEQQAIVCSRRKTAGPGNLSFFYHTLLPYEPDAAIISYETDRLKFVGRRNNTMSPQAMESAGKLSCAAGGISDPVAAIRCRITIPPGESRSLDFLFGMEEERSACERVLSECQLTGFADQVFSLSEKAGLMMMKERKTNMEEIRLFRALAAAIIYPNNQCSPLPEISAAGYGHATFWKYGISARLPVVLVTAGKMGDLNWVEKVISAQVWWRLNGIFADIVILNDARDKEVGFLENHMNELIIAAAAGDDQKGKGTALTLRLAEIPKEDGWQLKSMARMMLSSEEDLAEIGRSCREEIPAYAEQRLLPENPVQDDLSLPSAEIRLPEVLFFNGYGGFSKDGKEYIIHSGHRKATPMPWANVLCNPGFGTIVTESGHSYTWSGNAGQYRLTPWHNDPLSDVSGEAYYLADEDSNKYWSLSYLPSPGNAAYITRHGFGYTVFEHEEDGIATSMKVYTDLQEAVKYTVITVCNRSGRPRRLSVTGYTEWVLGINRERSSQHVYTDVDKETGAILAGNRFNQYLPGRLCFFCTDQVQQSVTCDRLEFIGRNGTMKSPLGMKSRNFSGRKGIGLDACAAINAPFDLADGAEYELVFLLGCGKDSNDAMRIIRASRGTGAAENAFERGMAYWEKKCGKIKLHTPDPAVNVLVNGWLTYQTISSRLWARSGYYESSGAFGFRDQLQDMLSLLHVAPLLARRQLINCAAHQFEDGDVLHWWHPALEKGSRTRCSDDLLWMPYLLCRYVTVTGDIDLPDEILPYLSGRKLDREEKSVYDTYLPGDVKDTLYGHCRKAIDHALNFGTHGLPLIGTGDWNDSMSHIGQEGKGESVWLAWFLHIVLLEFAKIAELQQDEAYAGFCRMQAETIRVNAEQHAWDGDWYRSSYDDNGRPVGSAANEEGRIDAATQAWAVLSGAVKDKRMYTALESAGRHLVDKEHKLVRLLVPAFDKSPVYPGYIRGFLPGVKENGGQHTPAAIWLAMAFAGLRNHRRCGELLDMINPVKHTNTADKAEKYKAEPYVMAEDVYSMAQHEGRAGWTWFTGASGWMYQFIVEHLAGLKKEGTCLRFNPCLPEGWKFVEVHYKFHSSTYHIIIEDTMEPETEAEIEVDGRLHPGNMIQLLDDGGLHQVRVKTQIKHAEKLDFIL